MIVNVFLNAMKYHLLPPLPPLQKKECEIFAVYRNLFCGIAMWDARNV